MRELTSTERLRELLDERGESYVENDFGITWSYYSDPHTATESMDGTLIVTGLTPEQAIAATLGAGTCKLKRASWDDGTCTWGCICTACDAHLEHETGLGYNFCPICGAKVVD